MTPKYDLAIHAEVQFAFAPDPKQPERRVEWFKDEDHLRRVIDALAMLPLFEDLKLAGTNDGMKKFSGVAAAKKLLVTGSNDGSGLQDGPDAQRQLVVRLGPQPGYLDLRIWAQGTQLAKHRKTIIDQLVDAATNVRAALRGVAGLQWGYVFPIHTRSNSFEYPRPRPPRAHAAIKVYSIVDLIDLPFHRSEHEDAAGKGAEAVASGQLPAFARKHEQDGLVVLRWADDAGDVKQLQRGAAAHEAFIGSYLPTVIDGDYNELGDQREERDRPERRPPLTLYSAGSKTGYKSVVVFPNGEIEQSAWDDAKRVLDARKLPDGAVVKTVKLIVPLRELVFKIGDRAKQAGFAAVLYIEDDGELWNPDPPGDWATPPRASAETPERSEV